MARPKGAGGNIVLALRIVQLRKLKGMSQKQLGDAVGVSYQQIQRYEKGTNRIAAHRLKDIAAALGVSLDQLEGAHADLMASIGLPSGVLAMPAVVELLHAFAKITKPELRTAALAAVAGIAKVPAVTTPARLKLVEAKADLTSRVA